MRGVCTACGTIAPDYAAICPACGHRPQGEGLLAAWLLSENAISAPQMDDVARRIRAGEPVRPTARMLARARRALHGDEDGLTWGQRAFVLYSSLLFTAMPGILWAVWYWQERPKAALQVLLLSAPAGILATVLLLVATYAR